MSNSKLSAEEKKVKIKEILAKYREAGEISKGAKELVRKITIPGANAFDICQQVENYMRKNGAKPAFPTNISINTEAAHYSAEILDDRIVPDEGILKMDLGCHIDGYIVDTAITINHNPDLDKLDEAAKMALDEAVKAVKPGIKVIEIGKVIEKTITKLGFKPIKNLSGHQIKRYILHAGVSIPNHGPSAMFGRIDDTMELGKVYAIEPFASTGKGWIRNGKQTNIFSFKSKPNKKQKELIPIYNKYYKITGPLPFSPRFLFDPKSGQTGKAEVEANLLKLKKGGLIRGYPVLVEDKKGSMVSQYEHTLRVTKKGAELFT